MQDDILAIDLNRLEDECVGNDSLIRQWADKLAIAKRDAALAENNVKLVKAEMGKKIRQRPSAYGLDKTTDSVVADAVIASREYQDAIIAQIEADYAVDTLKDMVGSIYERGKQLTNLCSLHGQQYWSKPRADPETRAGITGKEGAKSMNEVNEAINKARQKPMKRRDEL